MGNSTVDEGQSDSSIPGIPLLMLCDSHNVSQNL